MDPQRERIQADLRGLLAGRGPLRRSVHAAVRHRRQHLRDAAAGRGAAARRWPTCGVPCGTPPSNRCRFTPAGRARAWPANRSGRGWCSISRRSMRRIVSVDGDTVTRAAGRRARPAQSLSRRARPAVRPRSGDGRRDDDGQRAGHRRLGAATGCGTARPGGTW